MAAANRSAVAGKRSLKDSLAARIEVLEREKELRTTLLATVAHDLLTPLATMKIATSSLRDPPVTLSDNARGELSALLDGQVDHLSRLVSGLLDLARSEAGVFRVERKIQPAAGLLEQAVSLTDPLWKNRQLVLDKSDNLPAIEADPLLIVQVIVNLLENANRYGPPGTPITVAAQVRAGKVEISVADHGPGVPLGFEEAIFEPFLQRRLVGRAGLGLAIAKMFVEAHQQRIWVQNGTRGGARFAFSLTIATGNQTRQAPGLDESQVA